MAFFGRGGGSIHHNNVPQLTTASTIGSAGGSESLIVDGTGPDFTIKGLTAGTGITLTSGANDITITNSDPGSAVSLSSAGGTTLVNDGTGPTLAVKGLTAGTGVTLTPSGTDVTITNSSPASSVTLASAGIGASIIYDGVGPALETRGILAGTGMLVSGAGTDVTITNNSPASSVTLSNAGAGASLVNDGTGPALATQGLVGGTGITVAGGATDVTLSVSGLPGASLYQVNVNVAEGAQRLLWTSPALSNGTYACCAFTSVRPTLDAGISAYRSVACVWVTGGVASLRGAGISDNLGGVGSGVVSFNPIFGVSGSSITLLGGDAGVGTVQIAGTIYLYPQTSVP